MMDKYKVKFIVFCTMIHARSSNAEIALSSSTCDGLPASTLIFSLSFHIHQRRPFCRIFSISPFEGLPPAQVSPMHLSMKELHSFTVTNKNTVKDDHCTIVAHKSKHQLLPDMIVTIGDMWVISMFEGTCIKDLHCFVFIRRMPFCFCDSSTPLTNCLWLFSYHLSEIWK